MFKFYIQNTNFKMARRLGSSFSMLHLMILQKFVFIKLGLTINSIDRTIYSIDRTIYSIDRTIYSIETIDLINLVLIVIVLLSIK